MAWVLALALTYAAGNHGSQKYYFTSPTAEAECRAKEAERRVWVETQVRDGGVQQYSVVSCHQEESPSLVSTPYEPWRRP